jgi:hypothetical protein
MQQKKYQGSVQITQGEYTGTYWTDTDPSEGAYHYYLDGDREIEQIHFTVINTGGGKNPPEKFHISLPVGGANFQVKYTLGGGGVIDHTQTFDNRNDVRSDVRTQGLAYLDAHRASLDQAAQEFANKVWR